MVSRLFGTQLNETAFADIYPDKDRQFGGLNFGCKKKKVEVFFLIDVDRTPGEGFVKRKDIRSTAGVYSARKFLDKLDYVCNAAYQFGQQQSTTVPDTAGVSTSVEKDIAALMFSLEVGYNWGDEHKARIAALFDYASGDDDPADDKFKSFNNLY